MLRTRNGTSGTSEVAIADLALMDLGSPCLCVVRFQEGMSCCDLTVGRSQIKRA